MGMCGYKNPEAPVHRILLPLKPCVYVCAILLCALSSFQVQAQSSQANGSCIWYSDGDSINQFHTDTNKVAHSVALKDVDALAMNGTDCGVVVLARKRLYQFNTDAVKTQEIELRSLNRNLDNADHLVVDPFDGSVWLADEKNLLHLSADSQKAGAWAMHGHIRTLAVGLDQSVWLLGNKQLSHYSLQGALLAAHDLHKFVRAEPKYMSIDSIGGVLWIAGGKQVVQLKLDQPNPPAVQIDLPHESVALTANPKSGELWVATKHSLLSYGRNGGMLRSIDLRTYDLHDVQKVVFDPASRSLWVLGEHKLIRFAEDGAYVTSAPVRHGEDAIAVPAFILKPSLLLNQPSNDALTNNPMPVIRYSYGTLCNSESCEFGPSYFNGYSLTATLNQQSIGPFVFDSVTGQASYTPSTKLPEGRHVLSAQVKDSFGHLSAITENTFTIDTVPPRFLSTSPVDGAVVTASTVTLQGTVDDPGAAIILDGVGQVPNTSADGGSLYFRIPVTLQPGINTFTLTAIDRAGNSTQQKLQFAYSAISVAISSPANGSTIQGRSVLVTGTYLGGANTGVTVNNIIAAKDGDRFYAEVPLQAGENTLTVTGTMPGGSAATQKVVVVSTGTDPFTVSASRMYGPAPLTVDFTVNRHSDLAISGIDADFDGNGTTDLLLTTPNSPMQFVYANPGVYPARFRITDVQGNILEKSMMIVVQDRTQLVQQLKEQWDGLTAALVKGNKDQALSFLTPGAQVKYGEAFEILAAEMQSIVASFSALQAMQIGSDIGEFALHRTIDGEDRVFLIYFLLNDDGIWRLESM